MIFHGLEFLVTANANQPNTPAFRFAPGVFLSVESTDKRAIGISNGARAQLPESAPLHRMTVAKFWVSSYPCVLITVSQGLSS